MTERTLPVLAVAALLSLMAGAFASPVCAGPPAGAQAQPSGSAAAPTASAAALEGDWAGEIDAGPTKLHIALHVHTHDGKTIATLDSPDQNALGLSANVAVEAGHVRITASGAAGVFDGEVDAAGASLRGRWSGYPTTLGRLSGRAAAALRTPMKPYPYREDPVSYPGGAPDVRIAATLTLPRGGGPFPAVVLISGSGPNGRDEQVFGHPLFLVLADYLTRQGIAVLRYDKRGIGQSTGDYAAATSVDFAADAEAGVAYLRTRSEIDRRRIGLIGHSEGGIIAPDVAASDPGIAFIVLMAGSGVRGDQIIMSQSKAIEVANGAAPAAVDASQAFERRFLDTVIAAKDQASAEASAREMLQAAGMPAATAEAQAKAAASPWYRFFLVYDPAPTLRRLRIPVLALIGSKDLQVPASQNIAALRAELGGDPRAEVVELQGLNHLFQDATTGAPSEYSRIEETMSPKAMQRIAHWILLTAAPPRSNHSAGTAD